MSKFINDEIDISCESNEEVSDEETSNKKTGNS